MSRPGIEPVISRFRSGDSTDWATGAGISPVYTWRYCLCMCKFLMLRYSRSVNVLYNVKKNNIDLFEEHLYVSTSKYMYRRASTDNMTIHVCTLGTPNYWKKRQVTLIKKGFNSFKKSYVIGPFKYACTWRESVPTIATPILLKKRRCWYHLTYITQILL